MSDSVAKALNAAKESRSVDFKREVDFDAAQTWPELVKDIVAMANSGGGVILVGLDDSGVPSRADVSAVLELDPAVLTDKVYKYTGVHFEDFEITQGTKKRRRIAAIEIGDAETPIAFTKPGTYAVDEKQKTAFSKGAVYFRHGAKSEPGTTADIRRAFDRRLNTVRRSWLSGVKAVTHAVPGARVVALSKDQKVVASNSPDAIPVRITNDPSAPAYYGVDHDATHPYRQKELIARVNKRFAGSSKVNQYDIQCVNRVHGAAEDPRFCHHPKYSSPQYSEAYVEWLVHQAKTDSDFFAKAREESYRRAHAPPNKPVQSTGKVGG